MAAYSLSVIIPAFNEAVTIGDLVRRVSERHPAAQIVVVDDGSSDGTGAAAADAGAVVVSHPYNIGNGAAVKSGLRAASGEFSVLMDGDGQHDPADIETLLNHMPAYDMVVGARTLGGHASGSRAIGNTVYNWLASYVAKVRIDDLTSGFRAVKTDIARRFLYLLPNTYSYPTTLTLGVLRTGRSVRYVPVNTRKRRTGKSQVRLFKDGVRFLMIIIKICTLYSPMRVFLPVSAAMFLLGLIRYGYSYITEGRFTNMSMLLFATSVMVFMMGLVSEQICQMRAEGSEIDPPTVPADGTGPSPSKDAP